MLNDVDLAPRRARPSAPRLDGAPRLAPFSPAVGASSSQTLFYRRASASMRLVSLAVALAMCGCTASLRRHAEWVTTPSCRAEVAEALGALERLRAEGWLRRIQAGECRRTYERADDVVVESGDIIGDIAGASEEETTSPECRAALATLEDVQRLRARLEADPQQTGALAAFAAAVAELGETTRPCGLEDDRFAILVAIVRHEFELSVWAPATLRFAELTASCEVPTLGGPVEIRPPDDTSTRWAVSSLVVLRGDVLPDASRLAARDVATSATYVFDDWLAPVTGPWASVPVVLVQTLLLGEDGATVAIYEVVRARDGWRVSTRLRVSS